jgi:hypothetical protein
MRSLFLKARLPADVLWQGKCTLVDLAFHEGLILKGSQDGSSFVQTHCHCWMMKDSRVMSMSAALNHGESFVLRL